MVWWDLQDKWRVFDRYFLAYLPTQLIMFMFRSAHTQEARNSGFNTTGFTTLAVLSELRATVTVL